MKILAAVSREVGNHLSIEPLELDEPRSDEVRVRIMATGICHTDHTVMQGQFYPPIALPMVLGHEGAGVVDAVGQAVSTLKPGDPVVLTVDSCGACNRCRSGRPGYCESALQMNFGRQRGDGSATLTDRDGAVGGVFFGQSSFATYAIARATNAVKVPADLPLKSVGPLGCGLQTGAGAVLNVLKPPVGSSIAILGVGTVGLAAVMAARLTGCDPVIAVDTRQSRLEMARELGATHLIDGKEGSLGQQLRKIVPKGLDAAIDASAVPRVFADAVDTLRTAGTIILLGAAPAGTNVTLSMNSLLVGKTIRGSIQGDATPHEFIPKLAALWQKGLFPFDKLITYYPFDAIDRAVHDTTVTGATIKAVLIMPES